ncbi:MAG: sensor histidine kinase [Phycisphaerae bacterium]
MIRKFALLAAFSTALGLFVRFSDALSPDRALTQSLRRIWQFQQGLPDATILCVRQLGEGYLYLGTPTGLTRFDGIRFTRMEAVGDAWVEDVAADDQGDLWVATDGRGVIRVHDEVGTGLGSDAGLPSLTVRKIFFDRGGRLIACTSRGVAAWDGKRFFSLGENLGDVAAGCAAVDGHLWFGGSGNQLHVWDGKSFKDIELRSIPANAGVRAILQADDGTMWVGTTVGLVRLRNGQERLLTVADGLADDFVHSVTGGANGVVWVGTRNGFSRVRLGNNSGEVPGGPGANLVGQREGAGGAVVGARGEGGGGIDSFRAQDGLSQSTVYSVCEDREGSVWVGTKHGLNQFWDGRVVPFTVSEGLPTNDVGPVCDDGTEEGAWVGTLGAGLSRVDGRGFTTVTTAEGLASDRVLSLARGEEGGGLWVGTDRGVTLMRGGKGVRRFAVDGGARELLWTREAGLWVGTQKGLLVLAADAQRPAPPEAAGVVGNVAITGLAACGGEVLVATGDERLVGVKAGKVREIARGEMMHGVDALFVDPEGVVWVGTDGGGLRMVDVGSGKVAGFSMREGLFDDEIYGIVQDREERLWMACSKGIFYVPRGDLKAFAAGKLGHLTCTPFSPTEALRTIECRAGVEPAAWRMGDGRLWFSTIHGVIVIDPQHLQRATGPARAVIEEVVVNGHTERAEEIGRMAPGKKNLEFQYTGLSFIAPARITFRYQLEGFDKEWVDAGARREVFYANLSPGTYKFRVQAKNIEGVWSETAETGEFTLAPQFWQRKWFWPVCLLVAAGAAIAGYRLRVRAIKGRMGAIVAERSRIARELHDTLLQGFSGVTMEMQALSARLPESGEKRTLVEIIRDAANCMKEARRSVAGLRRADSAGGELGVAVAEAARQLTETREVKLSLDVEAGLPALGAEVEYNLVRIAQEAVANAVKHSGARTIEVGVKRAGRGVRVVVADDGKGFDGAAVKNGVSGHYGIVGMRERAAAIGGRIEVASGSGRGTVVEVVVGE